MLTDKKKCGCELWVPCKEHSWHHTQYKRPKRLTWTYSSIKDFNDALTYVIEGKKPEESMFPELPTLKKGGK